MQTKTKRRTSEQVDNEMLEDLTDSVGQLREMFIARINAGLPLRLSEWRRLGDAAKEVWETVFSEYRLKNLALEAHYLADTIQGGTLAIETVWDILPEELQDRFQLLWSRQNAEQNRIPNERTDSKPLSRDFAKRE